MDLKRTAVIGSLILLALSISCGTPEKKVSDMVLPDMERLFNFYSEKQASGALNILADSLKRANEDLKSSELFVQAAFVYWEGGESDSAVAMLHKAIDHGMSNPRILEKFADRKNKIQGSQWSVLEKRLDSIGEELSKLSHFEFRTEAMDAFWPYFNAALKDTSDARNQLKKYAVLCKLS